MSFTSRGVLIIWVGATVFAGALRYFLIDAPVIHSPFVPEVFKV